MPCHWFITTRCALGLTHPGEHRSGKFVHQLYFIIATVQNISNLNANEFSVVS